MKVLIACEESQEVCKAFREKGHEAYSCDLQQCSGGHPEWHINYSCSNVMWGGCEFITQDGERHSVDSQWDLIIAHPPCTFLTVSGNAWFNFEKYCTRAKNRYMERADAIRFFLEFATCNAKRIAIENPVGIMSNVYRKPDQIIQPWQFGHDASKKTCLWLHNLPPLEPTEIIPPHPDGRYANQTEDGQNKLIVEGRWIGFNDPRTAKERSKTYHGIAKAMADQWG